jgi:acetyl esterase/lipase
LYLHGGGYVLGSPRSHAALIAHLVTVAGCSVFAPDYRLAPEHPYPAAVDDACAVYGALAAHAAASRIAIVGDSAGAGLALALLLRARESDLPPAACAVLLSPWVNLARCSEAPARAWNDWIDAADLEHCAALYLAGADPRQPLVSPVYADLTGLPPLLVQAGGAERLRGQAEDLTARARAAGVATILEIWPDMPHAWHVLADLWPASRAALQHVAHFVRARGAG